MSLGWKMGKKTRPLGCSHVDLQADKTAALGPVSGWAAEYLNSLCHARSSVPGTKARSSSSTWSSMPLRLTGTSQVMRPQWSPANVWQASLLWLCPATSLRRPNGRDHLRFWSTAPQWGTSGWYLPCPGNFVLSNYWKQDCVWELTNFLGKSVSFTRQNFWVLTNTMFCHNMKLP